MRRFQAGQTLIEAVVGVAILSFVMTSATTVAVSSSKAGTDSYDRLRANQLAQEGLERMRSYRDDWIRRNPLSNSVTQFNLWQLAFPSSVSSFGPAPTGASWSQSGAETVAGKYTRKVWVANLEQSNPEWVNSDAYSNRVGDRKRVTSQVSWSDQSGETQTVSLDTVLVDYQGINPTLPPTQVSPLPLPLDDKLQIDLIVQTGPGVIAPTLTVYADGPSGAPLNGGSPIFSRAYPVSASSCGAGYAEARRCDRYVETISLSAYGVAESRTLMPNGQIRLVFSGDAVDPATGVDNNLIINSVRLSNQSAGSAQAYMSGAVSRPVSDPLGMYWNGTAYWIRPPDVAAPSAPTLSGSGISTSQIRLDWTASNDNVGVGGYRIYRDGAFVTSVSAGTLTYTDGGRAPATSYSYFVDAFDWAGNTARSNTVSVSTNWPAPTASMSASPNAVGYGGSSTISWSSTYATSCYSPQFGWVATGGSAGTGALYSNTTYSITCYGPSGSAGASATVSVSPPPPGVDFWADSYNVGYGGSTTLRWVGHNVSSCYLDYVGWVAASGTAGTGALYGDRSYGITCYGPGGSTSRSVFIDVAPPPPPPPPPCNATAGGWRESGFVVYITGGGSNCQYYQDSIVGDNGGGVWGPIYTWDTVCHTQRGGTDPWGWLSSQTWCG